MDPRLSYNFDEIESSVRQEIHTASARFNAAFRTRWINRRDCGANGPSFPSCLPPVDHSV